MAGPAATPPADKLAEKGRRFSDDPGAAAHEMPRIHGSHAVGIASARLIQRLRMPDQRREGHAIFDQLKRLDWSWRFRPEPDGIPDEPSPFEGLIDSIATIISPRRPACRILTSVRSSGVNHHRFRT